MPPRRVKAVPEPSAGAPVGLPNASTTVRTRSRCGMVPSLMTAWIVPRAVRMSAAPSLPDAAIDTVPPSRPVMPPGDPLPFNSDGTSSRATVPVSRSAGTVPCVSASRRPLKVRRTSRAQASSIVRPGATSIVVVRLRNLYSPKRVSGARCSRRNACDAYPIGGADLGRQRRDRDRFQVERSAVRQRPLQPSDTRSVPFASIGSFSRSP